MEYEDYLNKPTRENASEFISRAIEDHADEIMTSKTYADYIATRPRAERIGSHGLFTEEGVQVNLAKVSRELNLHNGNVWTAIISLRREDAERLGYNTGERWRQMLRAQSQELSDQLHIPMQDLKWFAAFHIVRAIDYLERATAQKNPYAAYLAGKIRLTDAEVQDILRAIRDFEIAAENGNDYAEYQLGKIYLYGKEVERDYEKAIAYLSSAAEHGNQYAEQLLHSIQSNRNWSAALGVVRLLHHLSRMIQNQLDDEKKGKTGAIDRKLKRKIDEKKQAHGLKQG